MQEKVSIIIPIYNSEKYLTRCIESIISQSYNNIEIIIVDDGSTDKSLNIANKYAKTDKRIIIISKEHAGVSDSRNIGIMHATGKYITFVDNDDWLEENAIELMLNKMKEINCDVLRCNYYRNYSDNTQIIGCKYSEKIKNKVLNKTMIEKLVLPLVLNGKMPGYMWLLLIKKEIFVNLNPLNKNLDMMEDTVFTVDLLLNIKTMYFYDIEVYHYYCNMNSASKSEKNYIRNLNNMLLVNKIFTNMLKDRKDYKELKRNFNSAHKKIIEDTCFNIFKFNDDNLTNEELKKIIYNDGMQKILMEKDTKNIAIYKKIAIKYIKNKNLNKLIRLYKLRNKIAKIKTILTKRRE